ncbi:MAG TPA: AAA family ATPase [Planctomycetota bacterium]|nr:AAA family ATPase [Planctomycetota bacterium]
MTAEGGAKAQVGRGFAHVDAGEFEDGIHCFDEAIRLEPGHARPHFGRGLCWHHLGEFGNAIRDYDEAIRLDASLTDALRNRGDAKVGRGDVEAGIDDLDEVIRLKAGDPHAHECRAHAWLRLHDFERALSDFDAVIRLAPENAGAHLYRGHVLHELGRRREALVALDEAIRLDPQNAVAMQTRAAVLQEEGEYDRAEEDLARAGHLPATGTMKTQRRTLVSGLLQEHFAPEPVDNITVTERTFPYRVRADLQRAADRLFADGTTIAHFCGVLQQYTHEGLDFARLLVPNPHDPATSVPPQYEEMDIGDAQPVRCLKNGLWLLREADERFAVLLAPATSFGRVSGLKFQIATVTDPAGTRITQRFFKHLEDAVLRSDCYRGKILSLEAGDRYSGESSGVTVHQLRTVERDEVILPRKTLDLLDRNVIDFTRKRTRLSRHGLSAKKGLLFYGPPGTGKTHTLHYLAKALPGHTTLLITAEQVGLLDEYMTLARLLQPSVVVMEDIDLIARDRSVTDGSCSEVLLHKLLNEMDGLRPDAEVLFILTTNRPETLERALASRPGRIDQAIEFPLPDDEGRAKLIRLYASGLTIPEDVIAATVRKTDRVSAAFIKELVRRAAQFQIERDESAAEVSMSDIDAALDELLFSGGSLNRKLLGADAAGPE